MTSKHFNKILIANRGEIACRVIRTARKLGIRTVAVYSDADKHALHVRMADEAIHIGAAPSRESYLVGQRIIDAAKKTGAEAVHPGYGFLSENAEFCQACKDNDLVFIGPPVAAIEAMGSKSAAKTIMEDAGVPLVPGYHGADQSADVLKQAANTMGYPVLLKAVAGGGGKGMRQVWSEAEFDEALATAKRESLNAFGNDDMLVEKYLTQPRHVEIQVFCDQYGNAVYLFERDCSVQRRHQKVIEEAPAPGMTATLRAAMGEAAIRSAQAINYVGAGTVEFLLDSDGSFYFMEMNTRLQVEHPVTEMISGQDLVEWQLRVATGEQLPATQEQLSINGHAFEARIYAEDPDNDFLPATGQLDFLQPPPESGHVRVDTGVVQGDEVSVYYDPMIAKLIVWDENRDKALQRLAKALKDYRVGGVTTNLNFLYNLANCKAFRNAELDTGFIEKHNSEIFHRRDIDLEQDLAIAALYLVLKQQLAAKQKSTAGKHANSPWQKANGWRLNQAFMHDFDIELHGQFYSVAVEQLSAAETSEYIVHVNIHAKGNTLTASGELKPDTTNSTRMLATINGHQIRVAATGSVTEESHTYTLYTPDTAIHFCQVKPDLGEVDAASTMANLSAPMNGTVVALLVEPNTQVKANDALMVMEAMKMEHNIRAPADGRVNSFYYQPGELVDGGADLLDFDPGGCSNDD